MKMEFRTPVALCLLVITTPGVTQNAQPGQPGAAPQPSPSQQTAQPQQSGQAQQNPQYPQPASPPPPRVSPQPQYPPAAQYGQPHWVHSVSTIYDEAYGFHYRPFRFHIDGGGTVTQQTSEKSFDNGWNAGLGLTWYPTSLLPLGLRIDGTYNEFSARDALLNQASAAYGTLVNDGTMKMWGGDADLELDLHLSHFVHMYFLAGGGWYRQQTTFRQVNFYGGYLCDWWGCEPGFYRSSAIVARNLTEWHFARNAGFGLEFAMGPRASFFAEARYMRLDPTRAKSDFLPIRAGVRF
jgi:Outer membrane protein beta-barrel domain